MRGILMPGGRREGRTLLNYFLQAAAAQRQHTQELERLRAEGWTVVEHTAADASVFGSPQPKE